jgi:hypothetical protein
MANHVTKAKAQSHRLFRGGFAKDGIAVNWLLVCRRPARRFWPAVLDWFAASVTTRLRTAISVRARATVAIHPGSPVAVRTRAAISIWTRSPIPIRARSAVAFTGAADLIAIAGSGRAADIPLGRAANITPLAAGIGSARRLKPGPLPQIGNHHPEALHGILGQLIPDPGKGAGTGQGGVRFELGDGHGLVPDEVLVGFVGHG